VNIILEACNTNVKIEWHHIFSQTSMITSSFSLPQQQWYSTGCPDNVHISLKS
jgi:hypothetical protein